MQLTNKVIIIISPQSWGNMFLAKHHYAIELAKYGNEVYFLNPPQKDALKKGVEIVKSNVADSLYLINHSLSFSYKIKFKWIGLFHFLMSFHIKKIEASIGKKIDIVWSFDLGNYYPFKYFAASSLKIFNPIDEPLNIQGINSANGCEVIISITREILEKYSNIGVPKHFIHHGLSDDFVNIEQPINFEDDIVRVGLSGNWLRTDLDIDCLLKIITENPIIIFEFWGTYKAKQSNIGGGSDEQVELFINQLQQAKNVILHGAVHPKQLAIEFQRMDAFLITYDILKDQSRGTNYHKIIEYLSTGKVIISNNITTYSNLPGIIEMTSSRENNNELPKLFKSVISNLQHYNQQKFVTLRKEFAIMNLYSNKIKEIEKFINYRDIKNI